MKVLKPPAPLEWALTDRTVFLAGSIEMGLAEPWQRELTQALASYENLTVLDPRRDDWDASWRQTLDEPRFVEQVHWELEAQERADTIAMYFSPATKAPITLLELGLFARSDKLIVACPEGYWRRGNVQVVCARYGVACLGSFEALVTALCTRLEAC